MSAVAQTAPHMVIANIILAQLGGHRFITMTGARDFLALNEDQGYLGGLQFGLPRDLAKNGINKVRITLALSDTYKIEALAVNYRAHSFTIKGEVENVYCDQLEDIFRDLTGLATRI